MGLKWRGWTAHEQTLRPSTGVLGKDLIRKWSSGEESAAFRRLECGGWCALTDPEASKFGGLQPTFRVHHKAGEISEGLRIQLGIIVLVFPAIWVKKINYRGLV